MHFFVFRTFFSLLNCHFPEAIWKFFSSAASPSPSSSFFLGKTGAHLTTIIWEEKERRCVDLIDSIIFSRSTCRRSKTTLRRCTHIQEKHYRWHTHTHIHVVWYKQKNQERERYRLVVRYNSHRQKSEKSIMLAGCVYVCSMVCIRLFSLYV